MESKAPTAAKKYTEKKNMTKNDICVIMFVVFGEYVKDTSYKKGDLEKMLVEYVQKNSDIAIKNWSTRTSNGNTTSEESANVSQDDIQTENV